MLSPRQETIAFQLWAHCSPISWNCTIADAATAIGVRPNLASRVANAKGWASRFRASERSRWGNVEAVRRLGMDGLNELKFIMGEDS